MDAVSSTALSSVKQRSKFSVNQPMSWEKCSIATEMNSTISLIQRVAWYVCFIQSYSKNILFRNSSSVDARNARSTKTSSASRLLHSESHKSTSINTDWISPAVFRSLSLRRLNSQVHALIKNPKVTMVLTKFKCQCLQPDM